MICLCVNPAGTGITFESLFTHISISFENKDFFKEIFFNFAPTRERFSVIFQGVISRRRKVHHKMLFQRLANMMLFKWILRIRPVISNFGVFRELSLFRCYWNIPKNHLQSFKSGAETFDTTEKLIWLEFNITLSYFPTKFSNESFFEINCALKGSQKLTFSLIDFDVTSDSLWTKMEPNHNYIKYHQFLDGIKRHTTIPS